MDIISADAVAARLSRGRDLVARHRRAFADLPVGRASRCSIRALMDERDQAMTAAAPGRDVTCSIDSSIRRRNASLSASFGRRQRAHRGRRASLRADAYQQYRRLDARSATITRKPTRGRSSEQLSRGELQRQGHSIRKLSAAEVARLASRRACADRDEIRRSREFRATDRPGSDVVNGAVPGERAP